MSVDGEISRSSRGGYLKDEVPDKGVDNSIRKFRPLDTFGSHELSLEHLIF